MIRFPYIPHIKRVKMGHKNPGDINDSVDDVIFWQKN